MFSRFFIHRPIFASVLSIIITLAGGIAIWRLPIAQYPEIAPPTVEVSASYPGADAKVVADTVAAPIEQQVNGVEGMLYMSSQCTNDGTYTLTVTFRLGVDLNMAQVLVQNRVAMAQPTLPELVNRKGVTVKKKSPNVLMIVNLYSPKGTRDNLYLSNYATIQLRDELARLPGVGDITYLGQRDYSMRLWLDPERMASRNISASDVVAAVAAQNAQVAAGQIGQPPVPKGQVFQFTMTTLGRLADPEQFANMILKTDASGRVVRMRDVARIEMGAQDYDQSCTLDGRPSVALSIYQLPGSNALKVADLVKSKMRELKPSFPQDLDYAIVYDTTPFISESIHEVRQTLLDAVLLVALVMLLFLQNWRSAVIPLIAVPVAIIGTFFVMWAMGFSLNNLTLFGLVLAIGIVVDDAIVVVEAVEYHIEHGLSPRDASIKAMSQVSGPVIAVGLVLAAVFLPCAFISGITGQFFRQFALTIATSTVISAFNSLTLSPALAAVLLRPHEKGRYDVLPRAIYILLGGWIGYVWLLPTLEPWLNRWLVGRVEWNVGTLLPGLSGVAVDLGWWLGVGFTLAVGLVAGYWLTRPMNYVLGRGFRLFNVGFDRATNAYTRVVGMALRTSALVLLIYGGLLALTGWGFLASPSGFIPAQDKGYLLVNVQLPDAASLERTQRVMHRIEQIAMKDRDNLGVDHTVAIAGQSVLLGANAPNYGSMYVMLQDFHHRTHRGLSADVIARRLQEQFQKEIQGGLVNIFGAPPVEGLGAASGFKLILEDRGDNGLLALQETAEKIVDRARLNDRLTGLFSSFRADTPWLLLDIDRDQAKTMGVSLTEIFNTLQVFLGSLYVNDFNRFGRTWQVNVQADAEYRRRIENLKQYKVRNATGTMAPLGAISTVRETSGPVLIQRYNLYPSAPVNGDAAAGVSSGQAIDLMQRAANHDLPRGMKTEWTELAFLQIETGNTAMWVFLLAVILVFLVLAAQYESWSLPLAVILVVPMCLLFSIAGVALARMDINIFTQVGFVVLVGLACKNAILIVEFAKNQREAGQSRFEATLAACRLRLRPIIMTSLAFIIGVVPLVLSQGAGAEMRRTLGVAVFTGMLGVTLFGIFLTPVFYSVIQQVTEWRRSRHESDTAP
ncbi:MAG: efflux RND transporter permease subunit [Thermoguttaceae bacterium]